MKNTDFNSKDGNNLKNIINSHKTRQNINSTPESEEENENQNDGLKNKAKELGTEKIKDIASEAVHATTGVPKGIVKPVVSAIVDKVGEEAIDEAINQAKNQVKKKIRQVLLRTLAAAMPYILGALLIFFVVIIIMTEFYEIVDKVDKSLVKVTEYETKFLNFSTGKGWKTDDELFFSNLRDEYNFSKEITNNGTALNAPLVAATIHYNYMIELDLYKEDEDVENESKHTDQSLGSEESLFDDFIRAYDTKNFYKTANDKLGKVHALYNALSIGQRRLLGHMVRPEFGWGLYSFSDAKEKWSQFFQYFGKGIPDPDNLLFFMIDAKTRIVAEIRSILDTALAYETSPYREVGSAGWMEYTYQNAIYELEEMLDYFENKEDYTVIDEETWGRLGSAIDNFQKGAFGEYENDKEIDTSNIWSFLGSLFRNYGPKFPAPDVQYIYTEEVYDNYLRNIYIPLTYGVGEARNYGNDEVIDYKIDTIVTEIHNQSDAFIYLFEVDAPESEDCHYELVGVDTEDEDGEDESGFSGSVTVNGIPFSKEIIDNLYVRITNGSGKGQTVSMEDYMIGVMYAEVNTITNIEARKANMVAQQTYLFKGGCGIGYEPLHQEADGKYYISIDGTSNCQSYTSSVSQSRADEIRQLYNEMKYEFLYNEKTGSLYPIQYRTYYNVTIGDGKDCLPKYAGSCMGQIESDSDAAAGMNYKEILAKYYIDSGLINSGDGKIYKRKYVCYTSGLIGGSHEGFPIRTSGCPNPHDPINNPYPNGSCVWYAKGRGMEIIETAKGVDENKKRILINALNGCYGDGNTLCSCLEQQRDSSGNKLFGYSYKPSDAIAGAIACYDNVGTSEYGHVIVVEDVNDGQVTISQWSGSCNSYTKPLSEMGYDGYTVTSSGIKGGTFKGYIFLLN